MGKICPYIGCPTGGPGRERRGEKKRGYKIRLYRTLKKSNAIYSMVQQTRELRAVHYAPKPKKTEIARIGRWFTASVA